ncbi:hypothetical protein [Pseudomonas fluorescens]|uniref:Uncharacterized protein n=1 Tax=Pseudomonas fluorescens TaxID=294 RepID=A0A5E7APP1_PSEFL|nr:hypothetical protein [Pseudomonas fluorescens]VVN81328.1 hypothetical protein PS723_01113 [Pseudomonas fluorescens]
MRILKALLLPLLLILSLIGLDKLHTPVTLPGLVTPAAPGR